MRVSKGAWIRRYHLVLQALRLASLALRNLTCRASVLGDGPVAVSLTSHGGRVGWSALAIETIAQGTVRPERLVLWLDEVDVVRHPPRSLRRLMRRGLEVCYSENYGPHTKYFPLVSSLPEDSLATSTFVTADDDILYPASWLMNLLVHHSREPAHVVCYRARRVATIGDSLAPYNAWQFSSDERPSPLNFATGVGGVLYPPAMVAALRDRGTRFLGVCPRADDVWLHNTALRAGVDIAMVGPISQSFPVIELVQGNALKLENVDGGQNDEQIARTYTPADVALLSAGEHDRN